jgi:hypothetical protein
MKRQNPTQQYQAGATMNGGFAVFCTLTNLIGGVAKLGVSGLPR